MIITLLQFAKQGSASRLPLYMRKMPRHLNDLSLFGDFQYYQWNYIYFIQIIVIGEKEKTSMILLDCPEKMNQSVSLIDYKLTRTKD